MTVSQETRNTRDGYAAALLELGEKDPRVVVLDADLAKSTQTEKFKLRFPDRCMECTAGTRFVFE